MKSSVLWALSLLTFSFLSPFFITRAWAQAAKPVLDTKIVFIKGGGPKVTFNTYGTVGKELDTNKIQSALVFYAYTMNKADPEVQRVLLQQMKSAVSKIATDQGLIRADLLQGNPMVKNMDTATVPDFNIAVSQSPSQGSAFDIKPPDGNPGQMAAAVVCLFHNLVRDLPENALRLMTLALGGMNKWYSEVGQASDPQSVIKAPSYALNLAVDILDKLSGKSK